MDQINKSDAVFLQTAAVTVASTTGRHLADIMAKTNGALTLLAPISYKHPVEDRAHTPHELDLLQGFLRLISDREINVSDSLPKQISGQLLRWAAKLIDMAVKVDQIKPLEFKPAPLAYIVTDIESGKPICQSCIYENAEHAGEGHLKETGRAYKITTAPVEEFPKALAEFRLLCEQIDTSDVYDDELAESLTPLK